ncbi:hypothetical protein M4578_08750 [Salipiger sp. P9]|uniref:hypothetical protein n=1 Tax=Salipiger pentaromativorans TaxID=2943193 RepID=UPI002156FE80|nr:hypothetical protein [Salipiger pentaromativorans]MCR8547915.1 hypothetical protein [Salipiger pentaromativorans]
MSRSRLVLIHGASGAAALAIVASFWSLALYAEFLASSGAVIAIRQAILYVLPFLVLAMAAAGASGARLAGGSKAPAVRAKMARMRVAALNGLLVLVPAAVFLGLRARAGDLTGAFAYVQLLELCAGALNIVLLGLNMRAGMAMKARKRAHVA